MAPLLRASFRGLRCSRLVSSSALSSQRGLLKTPESSYILGRWYGVSTALEETCSYTQTVNDTAGERRAVIQREDLPKLVDAQKSLKEIPTANAVKQQRTAKEPSSTFNTDELSSLIMGKLRSKNNPNGPKDNGVPLRAEFTSSKANTLPEGNSKQMGGDKWTQVMNSMRGMAAKMGGNLASGGAMPNLAKSREVENQDDFADLDLPQARDAAVPSKVSSKSTSFSRPAMDALRNFTPNVKPKQTEMQCLNGNQKANRFQGYQQKAKEAKATSSSFHKSILGDESSDSRSSQGSYSKSRFTFQELEPKTSPKTSEHLNESSYEAKNGSSHEVKSVCSHEAKSAPIHELERAFVEGKERAPSYAKQGTSVINRTIYPGYTVCIQNLPSQVNLAVVKEALSVHGEVISSFKKSNSDGSCNAFVELKTEDAMDGALASRWLSIDGKAFSIARADPPITTVARLSRVSAETTDIQLACVCEKFGGLAHIKRRGNGVYDVYYKPNELANMSTILDSLNEVTLNQRRLVALPAPLLHPAVKKEVLKSSEGQAWHGSQVSQVLNRIETGLDTMSVCFEDLKSLTAMEDDFSKLL